MTRQSPSDPHKNVFYFYHASARADDNTLQDPQLENNTTKALINLLEHDASGKILAQLVAAVRPGLKAQPGQISLSLQKKPAFSTPLKSLVALSLIPRNPSPGGSSVGGRPDAWIYDRAGKWAIFIESKLFTRPSEQQISGHAKLVSTERLLHREITWPELYRIIKLVPDGTLPPTSIFLKNQWLQYMETIGMAPFEGFTEDDLNFFIYRDPDMRRRIKNKADEFCQQVRAKLSKPVAAAFDATPRMGSLFDFKPLWIALQRKDLEETFTQCNFTLEVSEDGVTVNAVIRNGKYSDQAKPLGVLYRHIHEHPADFIRVLRSLGPAYRLAISSRENGKGGQPMPGADHWKVACKIHHKGITDRTPEFIKSLLEQIRYPGIHVGTSWLRGETILQDADALTTAAAAAIENLRPILDIVHLPRNARAIL